MKKIITLIMLFLFSVSSLAKKLERGSTYLVKKGSISTVDKTKIPVGTYIKVIRQDSWSTYFQVLDSKMAPLSRTKRASSHWTEASVVNIGPKDLKDILKNVSTKVPNPTDDCCQPGTNHNSKSLVTPKDDDEAPSILKSDKALGDYFACYQKNASNISDYKNKFKQSIRKSAKTYNLLFGDEVSEDEVNATLSCLLFRESAHWVGKSSATGAVGLGQFTGIAIQEVQKIINYKGPSSASFEKRIKAQKGPARSKNIKLIEAERKKHERYAELKELWFNFKLKNRPNSSQINRDYLKNNNNHEAVIALSTLMIRNCQIQLQDRNIKMTRKNSLLACAGAYNMGVGGFVSHAIGNGNKQTLNTWVNNLKSSNSKQKSETINHLISIHRCSQQDSNLPPCGTGSNYCQDLPKTNACSPRANPLCVGEC